MAITWKYLLTSAKTPYLFFRSFIPISGILLSRLGIFFKYRLKDSPLRPRQDAPSHTGRIGVVSDSHPNTGRSGNQFRISSWSCFRIIYSVALRLIFRIRYSVALRLILRILYSVALRLILRILYSVALRLIFKITYSVALRIHFISYTLKKIFTYSMLRLLTRTVAQHIQSVMHHSVSARTIRRRLQQTGLSARRLLLHLPLTQNHKRLMWTAK
ncbi:hypothetical protein LAZ67_12002955 [Cordylochernes scorpioides]|uniref:Transposase Tc1-like domain-containing protein n=1 Tax=Cordylochernes scorpioides TaxID=51811 RepID=A0ABY6L2X8_9ARAC|nr:hypothetical protein LAZ67_12002955 [Cordylochernes scorpioides]